MGNRDRDNSRKTRKESFQPVKRRFGMFNLRYASRRLSIQRVTETESVGDTARERDTDRQRERETGNERESLPN